MPRTLSGTTPVNGGYGYLPRQSVTFYSHSFLCRAAPKPPSERSKDLLTRVAYFVSNALASGNTSPLTSTDYLTCRNSKGRYSHLRYLTTPEMEPEFSRTIELTDEDMDMLRGLCLYEKQRGRDCDPAKVLSNALSVAYDLAQADS